MNAAPRFGDWTPEAVAGRIVEAARTLALCPRAPGPQEFASSMPEPLRRQQDAYASNRARYCRAPTAAAIARMEECWTWVNDLDSPCERKLLYRWARTRARRGRCRTVEALAAANGMSSRTLRRTVGRLCAIVAGRLNVARVPRPVESAAAIPERGAQERNLPRGHGLHWRAEGARPGTGRPASQNPV